MEYGAFADLFTVKLDSVRTRMNSGRYTFTVTASQKAKAIVDQLGWKTESYGQIVLGI
jgi:hypothetical protein